MVWTLLMPYVSWLGNTPFAMWLGQSTWRIAGLLTVHLFGLTLLLGSVLLTNLRLLGLFQRHRDVAAVRRDLSPIMIVGLVVMLASGLLIFTGGAEAYFIGYWFRLKMMLLAAALIFQFTIHRFVSTARAGRFPPVAYKLTGLAALLLWFGVGLAGRAIAFF